MKKLFPILLLMILTLTFCLYSCSIGTGNNGSDNLGDKTNECNHTFGDWITEVQPTCNMDGTKKRSCVLCDEVESDVVPATQEHTVVVDEAIEPTCSAKGLTEGSHCSVCGMVFMKQDIVPTTDHSPSDWIIDLEPTERVFGEKHSECTVCHNRVDEFIPAINNHKLLYKINEDGLTCTVTGLDIPSGTENSITVGDLYIPEYYKEYKVTAIGKNAFYAKSGITRIVIPDSVTEIQETAFIYCRGLTMVKLSKSLKSIGAKAFYECSALRYIELPLGLESIGNFSFYNGALYEITIPDSVKTIGSSAFKYNSFMSYIDLGNGVESIGYAAFEGCNVQEFIIIPDSVIKIAGRAFADIRSINRIVIGSGVREMGEEAFFGCDSVTTVEIREGVTVIGKAAFKQCTSIEGELVIPDSVVELGEAAFLACEHLTSIRFGKGITKISERAFLGCIRLETIDIPEGVTEIGRSAFYGSLSATSINLPNSLTLIGTEAFVNCEKIMSIALPEGLTVIPNSIFVDCERLKTVYIPDSVIEIGTHAFWRCEELEFINIPDGIVKIGDEAFSGCQKLCEITLPASLEWLGKMAFAATRVSGGMRIGPRLSYIGACTLRGTVELDENNPYFKLVDGILYTIDGSEIVYYDANKKDACFAIPKEVKVIRSYAIASSYLTRLIIHDGVTEIGERGVSSGSIVVLTLEGGNPILDETAFALTSLAVINNYTDLNIQPLSTDNGNVAENAKIVYTAKETIYPNDGNEYIMTDDKFLFSYNGTEYTLVAYCGEELYVTLPTDFLGNSYKSGGAKGIVHLTIPEGVTRVTNGFVDSASVRSVSVPNSVTFIERWAFSCSNLEKITIGSGTKNIAYNFRSACSKLKEISVSEQNEYYMSIDSVLYSIDGKTLIAYGAGRTDERFVIPDSVEIIGEYAFSGNNYLKEIVIGSNVKTIRERAFSSMRNLSTVTVSEGVTSIEDEAFYSCGRLVDITIPESVTSMGERVFIHCTGLKSIWIFGKIKAIGIETFYRCYSLETILIQGTVSGIGKSAFYKCDSIKTVYFLGEQWQFASLPQGGNNHTFFDAKEVYYEYSPEK